jgi:hypothetical protein
MIAGLARPVIGLPGLLGLRFANSMGNVGGDAATIIKDGEL